MVNDIGPCKCPFHPFYDEVVNFHGTVNGIAGFDDVYATQSWTLTHACNFFNKGQADPIYQGYCGKALSAEIIGWYNHILHSKKQMFSGAMVQTVNGYDFYLNPRKHEKTWTGHYRGSNASSETVICDNSYLSRKRVERMCTLGYTVSAGNTNLFWAGDFMHRLVHIPAVTEEAVGRYADDYDTSLELAKKNATFSVRNADSLQYFALDTYAFDIAVPEVGCLGEEIVGKNVESPAPAESAVAPVETEKKEGEESHFHVDGSEHCV